MKEKVRFGDSISHMIGHLGMALHVHNGSFGVVRVGMVEKLIKFDIFKTRKESGELLLTHDRSKKSPRLLKEKKNENFLVS